MVDWMLIWIFLIVIVVFTWVRRLENRIKDLEDEMRPPTHNPYEDW